MKSQIKKIFAVLVCVCLMLSVVAISASADPATTEIVLTVDSLGLASQSYSASTKTVDGAEFEWIQLGNYNNGGIQVRDKNGNTSSLWNTAAFSAPIKEIKLVYSDTMSVDYANADCAIYSFGNEAGTYTYETKLSTEAGVKEYTITPDAETYTFFKFEHDLGYTHYWKSITIVLVGGGSGEGGSGDGGQEGGAGEGGSGEGAEPTVELVTAPEVGVAYKFGMVQENVSATDVYCLKGGMEGYYMATSTTLSEAIDVYLEAADEGGYRLYTMIDGVKTYINMVISGTYVNGAYEAEATANTVYAYDAEKNTIIATITVGEYDPSPYWFGTRNDKTYTTVGPCLTKYEGFYCQFYKVIDNSNQGGAGNGTGTGTGTGTGAGSNNTTKPIPVTSDANVVVMMVVMAVAAATVFVAAKKCKN